MQKMRRELYAKESLFPIVPRRWTNNRDKVFPIRFRNASCREASSPMLLARSIIFSRLLSISCWLVGPALANEINKAQETAAWISHRDLCHELEPFIRIRENLLAAVSVLLFVTVNRDCCVSRRS